MQITVNETGARTIRDSRPMQINGQGVYVVVDSTANLFVGGRLVDVRRVSEVTNATEAQAWAVEYRENLTAQVADEAAVAEATDPGQVYAGAVGQVRAKAAELLAQAEAAEAHGAGDYRVRSSLNGRMKTFTADDPRHPVQAAKSYRADAAILGFWTATDEQGYVRYVQDGLGATDGYFAPAHKPKPQHTWFKRWKGPPIRAWVS